MRIRLSAYWQTLRAHPTRVFVLAMTLLGGFLRFWRLPETLQFLGDQGRDALIVSKIFLELDPVFIGPVTSVGNMYLGPLYYYFMLPFQLLSYPSPMGPVYAVALLGTITIPILFFLSKRMFDTSTATFATILLTFSAVAIEYSRFSWNPNPAPLISIIMLYSTWKAWRDSAWWWVAVSACFSVLIQLHYLTLVSAGGAGLIHIAQFVQRLRSDKLDLSWWSWITRLLLAGGVFLASLTPLVLFDFKHDLLNAQGFLSIVTGDGSSTSSSAAVLERSWDVLRETHGRSLHFFFETTLGTVRWLNTTLLLVLMAGVGWIGWRWHRAATTGDTRAAKKRDALLVLLAYAITGVFGTAGYEGSIFNHYILYLLPVVFLLIATLLAALWKRHLIGKILVLCFIAVYFWSNVMRMPLSPLGWQLKDIRRTSAAIAERVPTDTPYNIVLLSETGDLYGMNYRYFLYTMDQPPVEPEEHGSAKTIVVINETTAEFNPAETDIYEVSVFPDKTIDTVYTVPNGPRLLFLRTDTDLPEQE